jgi:hypothetical protein
MKKTFTLLMLGTLTLTLLAFAFVTVQAKPEDRVLLQTTATPAPSTDAQAQDASGSVVVWDQFCVRKVPYTLLAIPQNASFEIVQPEVIPTPMISTGNSNEIVCDSVGVFRDQQVVVCRGPQLFTFTLNVSGDGASEAFEVPLGACPTKLPN